MVFQGGSNRELLRQQTYRLICDVSPRSVGLWPNGFEQTLWAEGGLWHALGKALGQWPTLTHQPGDSVVAFGGGGWKPDPVQFVGSQPEWVPIAEWERSVNQSAGEHAPVRELEFMRAQLTRFMSETSETRYAAGWMSDTSDALWREGGIWHIMAEATEGWPVEAGDVGDELEEAFEWLALDSAEMRQWSRSASIDVRRGL